MKKVLFIILMVFYPGLMIFTKAQKVYTTTGGEMIFQMSEINRSGDHIPTNLRWTVFLHLGTNVHLDLGNAVGFYSGVENDKALRLICYSPFRCTVDRMRC